MVRDRDKNRMEVLKALVSIGSECWCYSSDRVVVLIQGTNALEEVDRIMVAHGMTAGSSLVASTAGTKHRWMREYFGPWM
jgi:hypothetical protein